MRTTLTLDFLAYDNAEPTNDPADSIKIKKRVEESDAGQVARQFPIQIADEAEDQVINLAAESNDYLILLTDQTVSVKLNGSSDALELKPKAPGKMTPVMMIRGTISSLTVSNSSGSVAKLDVTTVKI